MQNLIPMTTLAKENFRKVSKKILKEQLTSNVETLASYLNEILIAFEVFVKFVKTAYDDLDSRDTDSHDTLLQDIKYIRGLFIRALNKLGYAYTFSRSAWDIPTKDSLHIFTNTDEKLDSEDSDTTSDDMAPTADDVRKDISKNVPDFDGNPDHLLRFVDAVELVATSVGTHEDIAVKAIKAKLLGKARTSILETDNTIALLIARLQCIKGDSTDVIMGKLMNLKQGSKAAHTYIDELSRLTESLKGAFISEGLTPTIADKYATKQAVKAMTTNASNDKVRLVMEAGQFSDFNNATSKFLESSNNTGNVASVLYMGHRGSRQRGRFRGNNHNNFRADRFQNDRQFRNDYNGRGRNNFRSNGRFQRGNNNRGGYNTYNRSGGFQSSNYNDSNRNRAVRMIEDEQGNATAPGHVHHVRLGELTHSQYAH